MAIDDKAVNLRDLKVSHDDLDGKVDDLKSDLSVVREKIGVPIIDFEPIEGEYIYGNSIKTLANFSRSSPIAVSKGQIVEFTATGYLTTVAMIATCNETGTTFTDKVRSINSDEQTYTYTVTENGFIVVSYFNRNNHVLIIKNEESNDILNTRVSTIEDYHVDFLSDILNVDTSVSNEQLPITLGSYVRNNGTIATLATFGMSEPISMQQGQTITFNAMGYLSNVSILAKVNEGANYTPLIVSSDNNEHTFTYTASADMSVVVSTNKNATPYYSIYSSAISSIENSIDEIKSNYFAFATMGIIGDSLASGASNYPNGAEDRPLYSWGKVIEREHGVDVSLFSFGGATTRSWLTNNRGLTAMQSADVLDCYVIGLGVNDAYSLGADYLGSISDIHVGDESQNADTYYGNLSKIIGAIKTKSPRAKVVCLTDPKGISTIPASFNQAVRDVVELYANTYLIDLIEDSFYNSTEFNVTWNGAHSTAVGYKLIAENIYNHISGLIRNNISEFLDIQWIIENHS